MTENTRMTASEKARAKRDMQRLIRLVLESPISDGEVHELDGERSLKSFAEKNTTLQTRIVLQTGLDAAKGDLKSAEFLFKYGGYEPVKEQNVTFEPPVFIDDISCRAEPCPIDDMDIGDDSDPDDDLTDTGE